MDLDLDEDELGGRFSWTPPPVPDRVQVPELPTNCFRRVPGGGSPEKQTWAKTNFKQQLMLGVLHPPKQTWNLKMDPSKRRFLLETIISRFHVNLPGCMG